MKFAIIFSVASLLLLPLARSADDATVPDELAIYKVLFSGKDTVALTKPDPKAKPIELAPPDAKRDAEYSAWLKKELPGVEDATIADYRRRALAPPLLTPNSEVGVKLVFVDRKTLDEIFRDGKDPEAGWTRFRERIHARGLTFVSRVGFNPGRTQALVFMDFSVLREMACLSEQGKLAVERKKAIREHWEAWHVAAASWSAVAECNDDTAFAGVGVSIFLNR